MVRERGGKPLDFSEIATYSARGRDNLLHPLRMARVPDVRAPLDQFFSTLPEQGWNTRFFQGAQWVFEAAGRQRSIFWVLGAEALNKGMAPLLTHLLDARMVQHFMLDGEAASIDFETAFFGHLNRSEGEDLQQGLRGMARETGDWMNRIVTEGARRGFGVGHALGRGIFDRRAPFDSVSLLANALDYRTPLTVHGTLGAEAIHAHPEAEGAMMGKGSMKDFQILAGQMTGLSEGGVVVCLGRNNGLERIFLNALNGARNQKQDVARFRLIFLGDIEERSRQEWEKCHWVEAESLALGGPLELMMPLFCATLQRGF